METYRLDSLRGGEEADGEGIHPRTWETYCGSSEQLCLRPEWWSCQRNEEQLWACDFKVSGERLEAVLWHRLIVTVYCKNTNKMQKCKSPEASWCLFSYGIHLLCTIWLICNSWVSLRNHEKMSKTEFLSIEQLSQVICESFPLWFYVRGRVVIISLHSQPHSLNFHSRSLCLSALQLPAPQTPWARHWW